MHRSLLVLSVALSACSVELQHDLPEDDANDIYVLLQRNGISATKDKDEAGGNEIRYKISVAKADVASAAQLLRDYSLPRPKADGLGVFKKMKGMIPTQTEEQAMFMEALGGEVSNALNRVPGVLEARTIVMIPEVNDLTQPDKKPQPTAAVYIKYRNPERTVGDARPPLEPPQVAQFVAKAVPELKPENVTVLMTAAAKPDSQEQGDLWETIIGIRIHKASASTFKLTIAIGALLMLAMAGLTAWSLMRGAGTNGNGNGARRRASSEG